MSSGRRDTPKGFAVGVDLGGTHIAAGAAGPDGLVAEIVREPTGQDHSPEAVCRQIAAMVSSLVMRLGRGSPVGVGVGVPGLIDSTNGVVRRSPNFQSWEDVPMAAALAETLGVPVLLDHDLRMITRGEWMWGAGRGAQNLVCIAVGTGIGMGIVADGHVYSGAHGNAGEFSHLTVDPGGPLCGCGNFGCLEKYCAGPAIAEAGRRTVAQGEPSRILELAGGHAERIDARTVFLAAEQGDGAAKKIVDKVCTLLGNALAGVVLMLDPELIIVGGGVAEGGEVFLGGLREVVARRAYSYDLNHVRIVPWALKDRAGVLGAALAAWTKTAVR
ncbi:MAG: ROK family protein [Spirochaetes bacterium]|nr:ROK family protein [Spirochaetota bacterium]